MPWISSRSISRRSVASYAAAWRRARSTLMMISPSSRGLRVPPGAGSSGKLSTSVVRSLPRYVRFSVRIAASPTSTIETSASGQPAASSRRCTVFFSVAVPIVRLRTRRLTATGIGANDLRDERMAHDVVLGQLDDLNPCDPGEQRGCIDQPAAHPGRQIDLRHVPVDDHPRTVPEPRQKHFELLVCCVLRLIEDDEGIRQRAAAHVRQRCNLDRPPLEMFCDDRVIQELAERVVERPQIWIHFFAQVARQKAELFACFDRRPGQHDTADLASAQGARGHRNREKRFTRPGRPDAERERRTGDRTDELCLAAGSRTHLASALRRIQRLRYRRAVSLDLRGRKGDVVGRKRAAAARRRFHLVEHAHRAANGRLLPTDVDAVTLNAEDDRNERFESGEILIELPENPQRICGGTKLEDLFAADLLDRADPPAVRDLQATSGL